jgi:NitT/TauT family transport system permease protein
MNVEVPEDSAAERLRRKRRAAFSDSGRQIFMPLVLGLGVIAVWEIVTRVYNVAPTTLPAPSRIFQEIMRQREILLTNAVPTTVETMGSFLASVVFGGLLGVLISYSRTAREALYPNVILFQLIPKVAIAPLFLIWLGIDWHARISIAIFIAFFPIVISTAAGLNAADPALLRLCRSLTASRWQMFFKVQLPSSLPFLFNGMKISITLALIGVIVAEFITSERGLGYVILFGGAHFDTPLVMAAIVVLCIVGLAMYGAVAAAERLIMQKYGT